MNLAAIYRRKDSDIINKDSDTGLDDFITFQVNPDLSESENFLANLKTKIMTTHFNNSNVEEFKDCVDLTPMNNDEIPQRSPNRFKKTFLPEPATPESQILENGSFEYHGYGSDRSSQNSIFSTNELYTKEIDDLSDLESIMEMLDDLDLESNDVIQQIDNVLSIAYNSETSDTPLKMISIN